MENNPASVETSAAKPSLMSKPSLNPASTSSVDEARILSSLSGAPAPAPAPTGSSWALKSLLLLVAGGALAYGGFQYFSQQSAPKAKPYVIIDEKADSTAQSAPATQPPLAKDTSPIAGAASTEAAQIINEPAPSTGKLTAALEDGVKPPKAALEKALESSAPVSAASAMAAAKPAVTLSTPVSTDPAKDLAAKTAAAKADPVATQAAPTAVAAAAQAKTTKPAAPADKTPSADKDVSLIAALLTHNSSANSAAKPAAPGATATSPAPAKAAASAPAPTNYNATDSNADATTIALKKCGDLNIFEREVCRVKTCNNQWESHPACKAALNTGATNASAAADALPKR
jgi:trimeric autotransporter adhesin